MNAEAERERVARIIEPEAFDGHADAILASRPPELEGLRVLSEKATDGPWFLGDESRDVCAPDGEETPWQVATVIDCCGYPDEESGWNAALIIAAVNYVRAALSASPAPPVLTTGGE